VRNKHEQKAEGRFWHN